MSTPRYYKHDVLFAHFRLFLYLCGAYLRIYCGDKQIYSPHKCGDKYSHSPQNQKLKVEFWARHKDAEMNERQRKILNRLWDGFEGKLTTQKYAKINHCSQDTALRDIQSLIEKHILRKTDEGGRSTNYELIAQ